MLLSHLHEVQQLADALDAMLGQTHDVHLLVRVLAREQHLPVPEQVVQRVAVDFVERRHNTHRRQQAREQFAGGQEVQSLLLAVPQHRVRLARARLAVREARRVAALEEGLDQGLRGAPVHVDVRVLLVVALVEVVRLALCVLAEIDTLLVLADDHGLAQRVHNVHAALVAGRVQGPLPHRHLDAPRPLQVAPLVALLLLRRHLLLVVVFHVRPRPRVRRRRPRRRVTRRVRAQPARRRRCGGARHDGVALRPAAAVPPTRPRWRRCWRSCARRARERRTGRWRSSTCAACRRGTPSTRCVRGSVRSSASRTRCSRGRAT
eukprot:Rhum_TRINITY_DN15333_c12_g1::Rhum_TRINITY_DN15333_c12_g1_i2::g.152445::m.152445